MTISTELWLLFFNLICACLAVKHVLHIWLKGALFERVRNRIEVWRPGKLKQLLQCATCLGVWVSGAAILLAILAWRTKIPEFGAPLWLFAVAAVVAALWKQDEEDSV